MATRRARRVARRLSREVCRPKSPAACGRAGVCLAVLCRLHGAAHRQTPPRPQKLSQYGLFVGNGSTQQPAAGVIPYDLNSPLFSDYAEKFRFVKLPAGTAARVSDDERSSFPSARSSPRRSPIPSTPATRSWAVG